MGARISSVSWSTAHDVHFYPSEASLVAVISEFVSEGIRSGQPVVVITTAAHRSAVDQQLQRMHPDLQQRDAEIVWIDVGDALASFMVGPMPNPELFHATVANLFERLMASRSYVVVRTYGEMVDLLWQQGNLEGAIALEKLWNALASRYAFNLLCAYDRTHFDEVEKKAGYHRVCAMHERVRPSPSV